MSRILRLVITGGPCAGKTTGLNFLKTELTRRGYKVLTVAETATEVISSGIPFGEIPVDVFQRIIISRMLNKEATILMAAHAYNQDVVILYDRALLDTKAYMPHELFEQILHENELNEEEALKRYDAVFHLITAADGAQKFYTLANNEARSESPELARELDRKTNEAWSAHPCHKVIDNSTPFKEKIDRLLEAVDEVLYPPPD